MLVHLEKNMPVIEIETKILIIEDEMDVFESMERCLSKHATGRDVNISVIHALTLIDAKTKFNAYKPPIVSTDLGYPLRPREVVRSDSGAYLVHQILQKKSKTKIIVYSGQDTSTSRSMLGNFGVTKAVEDGEIKILKKNRMISHDVWASTVLDAVFAR